VKAAAIAGALLLLLVAYDCGGRVQADRWEQRVNQARERTRLEIARADSMVQVAEELRKGSAALAKMAEKRTGEIQTRIVTVRAQPTPDTCARFIAARDSVIDDLALVSSALGLAHRQNAAAIDTISTAFRIAHAQLDSLDAVLQARPRPRSRLVPSVGVGPFVGACPQGMCYGVGINLSWNIR
jgi:hypothetical protein